MAIYHIYEGFIEKVEKAVKRIQAKCAKYGCDFHFNKVGEEFKEHKNPLGFIEKIRFILVEAGGIAKVDNWEFIAVIDHEFSEGNVIRKINFDVEIPERFYTSSGYLCEHCHTHRWRKTTCIIRNTDTGEFKQVGKSCLKDFTKGLDAEFITAWYDGLTTLESYEAPPQIGYKFYYPTKEIIQFAFEAVAKFGYIKPNYEEGYTRTTKIQVEEFFEVLERKGGEKLFKRAYEEMESSKYNPYTDENKQLAENALIWIKSQKPTNEYMRNLKAICCSEGVEAKYLGFAVSLIPTYLRAIEAQKKKEQEKKVIQNSTYKYSVNERVTFEVTEIKAVTSWFTQFGITYIYKILDTEGNVYIWKTTKSVENNIKKITGTVKELSEYNGIKQTVLTRCKLF